MQFVIHAYDATDDKAYERRMAVRADHLKNIERIMETGNVICAGGMTNEAGLLKGSVLVMEFAARDELDAYLKSEPYIINNVWEKVTVDTCNVLIVGNQKVVE